MSKKRTLGKNPIAGGIDRFLPPEHKSVEPESQQKAKPVKSQQNVKKPKSQTRKPPKQQKIEPLNPEEIRADERIKCTYRLEPEVYDSLEEAKTKLRRLKGRRVKQYEIVETALRIVLDDLEKHGLESKLAEWI